MKTYNEQSPSEMLTLLLDGELDSTKEKAFIGVIDSNPELGSEYKDLVAIRETVKSDTEAFTPPLESKRIIFSRLNFRLPETDGGNFKNMFKRIWAPSLAFLFMAFLSSLYFLNSKQEPAKQALPMVNSYDLTKSNEQPVKNNDNSMNENLQNQTVKTHKDFNNITFRNTTGNHQVIKNENNDVALNNNINSSINDVPASNTDFQQVPVGISGYINLDKSTSFKTKASYKTSYPNELPYNYSHNLSSNSKKIVSGFIRYLQSGSSFEKSMQSQSANIAFGFFYPVSEYFYAGFELGQEPFNQLFAPGSSQNHSIYFGGIIFKYDLHYLKLFDINPYIQGDFGASSRGMMQKGIIGLNYLIPGNIMFGKKMGFSFGYERSLIEYKYLNKLQSPGKYGFTYGMYMEF